MHWLVHMFLFNMHIISTSCAKLTSAEEHLCNSLPTTPVHDVHLHKESPEQLGLLLADAGVRLLPQSGKGNMGTCPSMQDVK